MINVTERLPDGGLPSREEVPTQKDLKDMSDAEINQEMRRLSKEAEGSLEKFKQQLGLDIGHPDDVGEVRINDIEELVAVRRKPREDERRKGAFEGKFLRELPFRQLTESARTLLNQYLIATGKWSNYPNKVLKARGEKN